MGRVFVLLVVALGLGAQTRVNFDTQLKTANAGSLPATCFVGQLVMRSNALYVCPSLNTWTWSGATWMGNVEAGGFNLSNVGALTTTGAVSVGGNLGVAGNVAGNSATISTLLTTTSLNATNSGFGRWMYVKASGATNSFGIGPFQSNDSFDVVYDTSGSASYLSLPTWQPLARFKTSEILFSKPLFINGSGGTERAIWFKTAEVNRWSLFTNSTAEGGSNAGSDFFLGRYNDAGSVLSTPLAIYRATGRMVLTVPQATGALHVVGSSAPSSGNIIFTVQEWTGTQNLMTVDDFGRLTLTGGGYNQGHLILGSTRLWIDSAGKLRRKASAPSSATDGTVVGDSSNVFNVLDYGAVGDCSTNDTTGIQAAIDAAEATGQGGVVLFPGGKCYVWSSVTVQAANITIKGYGAVAKPSATGVSMIHHNANGGGYSYFKVLGLKFVGSAHAYPNTVKAIHTEGNSAGTIVPSFITIRDISCEDINWCVYIDKSNDVLVDNVTGYNNTRFFAGSTTDSGAQSYSHRVNFSNIFWTPSGSAPSFSGLPLIHFQRVGGGSISKIQINTLREAADGIWLENDTQGIIVDGGLVIGPIYGARVQCSNLGSGSACPLMNQFRGFQVDQMSLVGIMVADGALETDLDGVIITGRNGPDTTTAYGVYNLSSGGTTVMNSRFQNFNCTTSQVIYMASDVDNFVIRGNRFWTDAPAAAIGVGAGVSTNSLIEDNFEDQRAVAASWIANNGGAGVTVRNNYPDNLP